VFGGIRIVELQIPIIGISESIKVDLMKNKLKVQIFHDNN